MRIAFFGGSFDPPHLGHIAIARAAIARLSLDRVLVAPVGLQPLKSGEKPTPYEDRLAMVRLAIQPDPRLEACALDGPRADGRPNYTLDTLAELRATLAPDDRLFCLVGADALSSLRHWHRARELLLFCDFIVASRPGIPLDGISSFLPQGIVERGAHRAPGLVCIRLAGSEEESSTLYVLPGIEKDISATEIRRALHEGREMGWEKQTVLAPAVAHYIETHGLYQ